MLKDELFSFSGHDDASESAASGLLPSRLRLLCVGPREPSWIGLTLQLDADGIEPQFRWVANSTEALTVLRDDSFDCVVVAAISEDDRCDGVHDAASLVKAIRASGCEDPIVLLAPRISDNAWIDLSTDECELLQSARMWDSPALVVTIKRALARTELVRHSRSLSIAQNRRMVRERDEAEHLLRQQRRIIDDLDAAELSQSPTTAARQAMIDCFGQVSFESPSPQRRSLPPEINSYYHELLRTYVIMGSGNISGEIAKLAELLTVAGCGPREALTLHLERVETLVRGLGNRSTRHILSRADLLALELMIHLGESYRRRTIDSAPSADHFAAKTFLPQSD